MYLLHLKKSLKINICRYKEKIPSKDTVLVILRVWENSAL